MVHIKSEPEAYMPIMTFIPLRNEMCLACKSSKSGGWNEVTCLRRLRGAEFGSLRKSSQSSGPSSKRINWGD
jgi:hypothetical protein